MGYSVESGIFKKSAFIAFLLIGLPNLFILINKTKLTMEVSNPPTSWTNPVPTRFRTPSTSVMILETNSPDLLLSKKRMGKWSTCFCTWTRNCEIKRCASTLKIFVRRKVLFYTHLLPHKTLSLLHNYFAAMLLNFPSPFTTVVYGMSLYGLNLLPSTIICLKGWVKPGAAKGNPLPHPLPAPIHPNPLI